MMESQTNPHITEICLTEVDISPYCKFFCLILIQGHFCGKAWLTTMSSQRRQEKERLPKAYSMMTLPKNCL